MKTRTKSEILAELGGLPEEIYDTLLGKFKTITIDQLDKIRTGITSGNIVESGNLAHSMKGAAANLRLDAIFDSIVKLEKDIKGGKSITVIEPQLSKLKTMVETLELK